MRIVKRVHRRSGNVVEHHVPQRRQDIPVVAWSLAAQKYHVEVLCAAGGEGGLDEDGERDDGCRWAEE